MFLIDIRQWKMVLAFVIICGIVFVEDIDIFYNRWIIGVLMLLFVLNALFICRDNILLGLLITILIGLAFVVYHRKTTLSVSNRRH
jgi:uncharacterized membrane protein YGL010W